jgi:hypothetical protein
MMTAFLTQLHCIVYEILQATRTYLILSEIHAGKISWTILSLRHPQQRCMAVFKILNNLR